MSTFYHLSLLSFCVWRFLVKTMDPLSNVMLFSLLIVVDFR